MIKIIGKYFVLLSFLLMGNASADGNESPLADLHKGILYIPCVYASLEDGSELIAINVQMNQNGSSPNYKVVAAEYALGCPPYEEPELIDEELVVEPAEDSLDCQPNNDNANNCHDKVDAEDDGDDADDD